MLQYQTTYSAGLPSAADRFLPTHAVSLDDLAVFVDQELQRACRTGGPLEDAPGTGTAGTLGRLEGRFRVRMRDPLPLLLRLLHGLPREFGRLFSGMDGGKIGTVIPRASRQDG